MCLGDHISQNALRAPRTTIPRIPPLASHTHSSQHAVGTTAVTAPLPGVWQLHVTTLWVSLVLEDELIVD